MNKYFKFPAESNLGIGVQYIEFSDSGWAVRQAECYGGKWFNSSKSYHEELTSSSLCDQKLTESGMQLGVPIDAQEFEDIWKLSNKEKGNKRKGLSWIFPLASAACLAFFLPRLITLSTGVLNSGNEVIGGSGSNNLIYTHNNPPVLVSESISFECVKYKNGFELISKAGNIERPLLRIITGQENWGGDYSPQARCQIIKNKLNSHAEKQQSLSITLGAVNGYDIACFGEGHSKGCVNEKDRGQILTLGRSRTNPAVGFNKLIAYFSDPNISSDYEKQSEILYASSKPYYIHIDLLKFVKNEKNYYEFSIE
jgi:hypothetical protein